jgi:protein-glutamine gamma-glutamyltransferase
MILIKSVKLNSLVFIFFALCLSILPHLSHITPWPVIVFILLGLWRIAGNIKPAILPNKWLLLLVTMLIVSAHILYFGSLFGREVGVSLLIVMSGLKLMETRTKRDSFMVVFLGMFIVITNFYYSQSIGYIVYLFVTLIMLIGCMIDLSSQTLPASYKQQIRLSIILLCQAIPLTLILFILFPRINGPIWVLPEDAHAGKTGLSENMTPGKISDLIQNNSVAFRVKFIDKIPERENLYWRALVLWGFDGKTWRQNNIVQQPYSSFNSINSATLLDPVDYTITLEPHSKKWLFGLDLPIIDIEYGQTMDDFTLRTNKKINKITKYPLTSYLVYHTGWLNKYEHKNSLQLPGTISPMVINQAKAWHKESKTNEEYIAKVLNYYTEQNFTYTLTPPTMTEKPTEEFLFTYKKGFCEHFSSSFVILMRAAGIPARVVTGYQGGEYNSVGGYFVIRQSDAHAWSEVWLERTGWTRVDPTASVAPERVEQTIKFAEQEQGSPVKFKLEKNSFFKKHWKTLSQSVDAVNHAWNNWFLGYDKALQKKILNDAGLETGSWLNLVIYLFIGFAVIFLIIFFLITYRKPSAENDPVVKQYIRFCHKIKNLNTSRSPQEGPRDFANRIIKSNPEYAIEINRITELYLNLRYRKNPSPGDLISLKQAISSFKPKPT